MEERNDNTILSRVILVQDPCSNNPWICQMVLIPIYRIYMNGYISMTTI